MGSVQLGGLISNLHPKDCPWIRNTIYLHSNNKPHFGSTRISNELGAGNHQAARVAVQAVLIISITEAAIASIILFFCRHIFGYAFSNEEGVVDYVAELAPLLCLSLVLDGLQAIFSGQFPTILQ